MNDLEKSAMEQKLKTLSFQNTKLTEQLQSQKAKNKELSASVDKLQEQQKQHGQTLLCVNSVWDQLNRDIISTIDQSLGPPPAEPSGPSSDAADDLGDPFLQRLLASDPSAKSKVLGKRKAQDKLPGDLDDTEEELQKRSAGTMAALARLLAALQKERGCNEALMAAVAASNADTALKEEHQRLRQQVEELHKQLDGAHAVLRASDQVLKSASDRLYDSEVRRQAAENELAEAEVELANAKSKLARLQQAQAAGGQGGASSSTAGPSAAAAASAAPARQGSGAAAEAAKAAGEQGGAAVAADDELAARLEELQQFLEQRTAECDREREAHLRTQSELRTAQARLQDESWVPQTATYQAKAREHMAALAELERKRADMEVVMRERDEARAASEGRHQMMETEKVLRNRLAARDAEKAELHKRLSESLAARHELERLLGLERAKLGSQGSVEELKVMVATLQREVMLAQDKLAKEKVSAERIDAARQEVAAAVAHAARREQQARRLYEQLVNRDAEAAGRGAREQELRRQIIDLNAFVDVCVHFKSDRRDVREVRESEAKMKWKVKDLEQQLQGHELHAEVAAAQKAEAAQRALTEAAQKEADGLRSEVAALQQQVAQLNEKVARMQQEADTYISEVETTSSAYENMEAQNVRLLQQLTEKDVEISRLLAERQGLQQGQEGLALQLEGARADVARLGQEVADMRGLKEAVDRDLAKAAADLATANEQLRSLTARMDAAVRDAQQKAEANSLLQVQLESAQQAVVRHQKALDEEAEKHQKERTKRQRLEEEQKVLSSKVDRLRKVQSTDDTVAELEEEVAALRNMLKCNVCLQRQKNVIITKCWHVFCQQCIKRNLETRHRKCPACSAAFGAADVHEFYLT